MSTLIELSQCLSDHIHRGAVLGYEGSSVHDEMEDKFGHTRRDRQLHRSRFWQIAASCCGSERKYQVRGGLA